MNTVPPSLIIGTYTETSPRAVDENSGILAAEFDHATGRLGAVTPLARSPNPSYLALSATGDHLYAVNETATFAGRAGGGVSAYARDRRTGRLTPLNTRSSAGLMPCHLALDASGRFALIANYDSGSVAVFELRDDGALGECVDRVAHHGRGVHPERQTEPHAHMIARDPATGEILVADLGIDAVLTYRLDARGHLTVNDRLDTSPGAGPRHLAFTADGSHLFVVNELDNTVLTARRDGPRLRPTHVASTLPADGVGVDGHSSTAAVRVSASGRHVLVSNRGHDSIALLRFDERTSALRLVTTESTHGAEPRDLALSPDGRHVVVANQNSDSLVCYEFDERQPALRPVHTVRAPAPACLTFA